MFILTVNRHIFLLVRHEVAISTVTIELLVRIRQTGLPNPHRDKEKARPVFRCLSPPCHPLR